MQGCLIVAAVRKEHHEIAGGVQEVEGLEQRQPFLDALNYRRARIIESSPLCRSAYEPDAQEDVLIVRRERCDDVRVVTESNERHQVVIRTIHSQFHEVLGRGDGRIKGGRALRLERGRLEFHHHAVGGVDD